MPININFPSILSSVLPNPWTTAVSTTQDIQNKMINNKLLQLQAQYQPQLYQNQVNLGQANVRNVNLQNQYLPQIDTSQIAMNNAQAQSQRAQAGLFGVQAQNDPALIQAQAAAARSQGFNQTQQGLYQQLLNRYLGSSLGGNSSSPSAGGQSAAPTFNGGGGQSLAPQLANGPAPGFQQAQGNGGAFSPPQGGGQSGSIDPSVLNQLFTQQAEQNNPYGGSAQNLALAKLFGGAYTTQANLAKINKELAIPQTYQLPNGQQVTTQSTQPGIVASTQARQQRAAELNSLIPIHSSGIAPYSGNFSKEKVLLDVLKSKWGDPAAQQRLNNLSTSLSLEPQMAQAAAAAVSGTNKTNETEVGLQRDEFGTGGLRDALSYANVGTHISGVNNSYKAINGGVNAVTGIERANFPVLSGNSNPSQQYDFNSESDISAPKGKVAIIDGNNRVYYIPKGKVSKYVNSNSGYRLPNNG